MTYVIHIVQYDESITSFFDNLDVSKVKICFTSDYKIIYSFQPQKVSN